MPTEKPTLSEQVQELADLTWRQHGCAAKGSTQEEVLREDAKILSEAACLLAPYEQPKLAELLRNARWLRAHPQEYMSETCMAHWADNLEAHAADLQRLEKLEALFAAPGPEVAELLRRAAEYEGGCAEVVENAEALATDLCRWAAALVALAEERAKLKRVESDLEELRAEERGWDALQHRVKSAETRAADSEIEHAKLHEEVLAHALRFRALDLLVEQWGAPSDKTQPYNRGVERCGQQLRVALSLRTGVQVTTHNPSPEALTAVLNDTDRWIGEYQQLDAGLADGERPPRKEFLAWGFDLNAGEQPCYDFAPMGPLLEGAPMPHECPECLGLRYFCRTCHRDHHAEGWESCKQAGAGGEKEVTG